MAKFWHFECLNRLAINHGEFDAWIIGVHQPNGPSACAWEIRRGGTGEIVDRQARRSEAQSTNWRGHVAALTAVAELAPLASLVSVCTRNEALRNAINGGVDNFQAAEWRTSGNNPVAAKDIWKRYIAARDGDGVLPPNVISAKAPAGEDDQDILDALKDLANRLFDEKDAA